MMSLLNSNRGQAVYVEKILSIVVIFFIAISSILLIYYVVNRYKINNTNIILNSVCLSIRDTIKQMETNDIRAGYVIINLGDKMTIESSYNSVFVFYDDGSIKCELDVNVNGICNYCDRVKIEKVGPESYLILEV